MASSTAISLMTKQAQPGLGWGEVPVGVQVGPLEADKFRSISCCGGLSGIPFTSRPDWPSARRTGATEEPPLALCLIHRFCREDSLDVAL